MSNQRSPIWNLFKKSDKNDDPLFHATCKLAKLRFLICIIRYSRYYRFFSISVQYIDFFQHCISLLLPVIVLTMFLFYIIIILQHYLHQPTLARYCVNHVLVCIIITLQ
jgi:hypothetical protein